MAASTPPRLHVLPARAAPVAMVLRRGPSGWFHVLRWHLDEPRIEGGAWLHGTLYPRRCDVSPDGGLLAYFAHTSRPPPWDAYHAVSKAPWLTALAAWHVGSTWTVGLGFDDDGALLHPYGDGWQPSHGSYPGEMRPLPPLRGMGRSGFDGRDVANELRRGWVPVEPGTASVPADAVLALRRERPGAADDALVLVHHGHSFGAPAVEGVVASYRLASGGAVSPLAGAAWADWDPHGRLLIAGTDGTIQIRERTGSDWAPVWTHDLGGLTPDPQPAPEWARCW
ncbi:MAG: hypothetical protein ACTHNU_12255 [Gaiellales bacterium]